MHLLCKQDGDTSLSARRLLTKVTMALNKELPVLCLIGHRFVRKQIQSVLTGSRALFAVGSGR